MDIITGLDFKIVDTNHLFYLFWGLIHLFKIYVEIKFVVYMNQ